MNNFFSHDSNARNSEKLISVRMKLGAEGYGIYFMILERLREEGDYMSIKDYNVIAFDLRVSTDKVKAVIEDFGLFDFTEDGKRLYSKSFLGRMQFKDAKSKKLSEAGKKGNARRWSKDTGSTATLSPPDPICDKKPSQVKESKVKETKEDIYIERERYFSGLVVEIESNETAWTERLCMNNSLKPSDVSLQLSAFVKTLVERETGEYEMSEFKIHFANWLKKQKHNGGERANNTGKSGRADSSPSKQTDFSKKVYTAKQFGKKS